MVGEKKNKKSKIKDKKYEGFIIPTRATPGKLLFFGEGQTVSSH
jgi:hypothetical protein